LKLGRELISADAIQQRVRELAADISRDYASAPEPLILLPVLLVISAFLAAQSSTYWTLAFRRLELDRPPVYAYAYPPPQVQPPPGLPS